jgi:hypothetical protein
MPSLANAAEAARAVSPVFTGGLVHVPNFVGISRTQVGGFQGPDTVLQDFSGPNLPTVFGNFDGMDNNDNASVLGFSVTPPDTNGDVGPDHYVQMVNLITTVYNKDGTVADGGGPFASNTIWGGMGGLCQTSNKGDPIVLYDETNDRWLFSQFAFNDGFTELSHCIAVSVPALPGENGDPLGAFNRYEFPFNNLGLPDYPKHGIVSNSITMTANLFTPPFFTFRGTFLAAIDKQAMYEGQETTMLFASLDCFINCEFGFLPADLDDPLDTADPPVPALFATAMSRNRRLDIWQLDVNWNQLDPLVGASIGRVADVRISAFDSDLCGADREACIPQPNGAPNLEAISDRLMHRLQIRDFGRHRRMVAAHTVDADGNGTAGIRWYDLRQNESNGRWSLLQESTYAPDDGLSRWMPSIALNAAGDIGMGFLVSSETVPLGIHTTGQTAASSGTNIMDGGEEICREGVIEQYGPSRSGDYGSTSVDPITDRFWHTNEYGKGPGLGWAEWGTYVCEFEIAAGACIPTPTEELAETSCEDGFDNDCDGFIDLADLDDCSSGGFCPLALEGESCGNNSDCCSGSCSKGRPSTRVCLP